MILRYLSSKMRYQQTYWLIAGAILGYVCFVSILGTTPLVIGVGGAIALVMIITWFWTVNQSLPKSTHNLLERETFLAQLNQLERQIDKSSQTTWRQAYEWAQATQQFANQIAQREPTLIPDLLEALHTVLALTQQVVSALVTVHQVKSSSYRPLAKQQLQTSCDRLTNKIVPPIPDGEVLQAAQSYWKQRKDGGRTVNLMMVIDTSGSMEGDRLQAVKNSLRIAAQSINPGNYVGLVTFSERPTKVLPLAPFDVQQHRRLLAAADSLIADGGTAMYDGMIVGLSELMERQKADPNGRFYLLLLTDGEVNAGLRLNKITEVLKYSGVRFYPIGYGEVNHSELQEIAKLRETTVKSSDPQKLQTLFTELFQTTL